MGWLVLLVSENIAGVPLVKEIAGLMMAGNGYGPDADRYYESGHDDILSTCVSRNASNTEKAVLMLQLCCLKELPLDVNNPT